MAKLTAEVFGNLPDDLQKKILEEVPADHLNTIEVITADTGMDEDEASSKASELLMDLTRAEALCCITELVSVYITQMMPPGTPQTLKNSASIKMMELAIKKTRETLKEQEEDDG